MEKIVSAVEKTCESTMKDLVACSKEEAVSSDFVGDHHSCILDVNSSMEISPNFFKLICWYENEYSYACRVVDTILFSEKQLTGFSSKVYKNLNPWCKRDAIQQTEYEKTLKAGAKINQKEHIFPIRSQLKKSTSKDELQKTPLVKPSIFIKNLCVQADMPPSFVTFPEEKQGHDMFKIKNDNDMQNSLMHRNTTVFRSCVEMLPKSIKQMEYLKTKQQLETVKREFTKMVSMTEDLLNSRKFNKINSSSTLLNKDGKYNFFDASGSFAPKFHNVKNDISQECSKASNSIDNIALKDNAGVKLNDDEKNNVDVLTTSNEQSKNISEEINTTKGFNEKPLEEFKSQVEKTINSLIDGLSQNTNEHQVKEKNRKENLIDDGKQIENPNDVNSEDISTNKQIPSETKIGKAIKLSEVDDKSLVINDAGTKEMGSEPNENVALPFYASACEDKPQTSDIESEFNELENINLSKKILERMYSCTTEPIVIVSRCNSNITNVPKCKVPSLNLTREGNAAKPDLYDKLDSTSATDSENSFQIDERRSQVINITDLTGSLEDLVRLDKICRIIEISDELSDKLFSNLNPMDNSLYVKNKKWSFKDLCERLKLDDFCNNVFGK